MSRLQQLYQQMILDHNRNPRNNHEVKDPTDRAHGHNPLCGDDYVLSVKFGEGDRIEEIGYEGNGCAISKSSASMMSEAVKGKSRHEAIELKNAFLSMLIGEPTSSDFERVGNLKILEGVKEFPVRVKCATLIWRTLENILNGVSQNQVTTE